MNMEIRLLSQTDPSRLKSPPFLNFKQASALDGGFPFSFPFNDMHAAAATKSKSQRKERVKKFFSPSFALSSKHELPTLSRSAVRTMYGMRMYVRIHKDLGSTTRKSQLSVGRSSVFSKGEASQAGKASQLAELGWKKQKKESRYWRSHANEPSEADYTYVRRLSVCSH